MLCVVSNYVTLLHTLMSLLRYVTLLHTLMSLLRFFNVSFVICGSKFFGYCCSLLHYAILFLCNTK